MNRASSSAEILAVEGSHLSHAWPLVTSVDVHHRSHVRWAIVERDPNRQHLVRRARSPIGPIGVPADHGFRVRQLRRFVDERVVEIADLGRPRQPGRDSSENRLHDKITKLSVLESDCLAVADDITVFGLPLRDAHVVIRQDPVAFAQKITLGTCNCRIDHSVRQYRFDRYQPCSR